MTVKIGCIVEGESEVETVPVLIRRIAANLYPELPIVVPPPIRRPRNKVVKDNELESAVEFLARKIGGQGAIFIILDSDDDCPAELDLHCFTEHYKLVTIYRLLLYLQSTSLKLGSLLQRNHYVKKED